MESFSIVWTLSQVDDVLAQAQSVSSSLLDQRRVFDNVTDKLLQVRACCLVIDNLAHAAPEARCVQGSADPYRPHQLFL